MPYPTPKQVREAIEAVQSSGLSIAAVHLGDKSITLTIGEPVAGGLQTGVAILDRYLREDSTDGERNRENPLSYNS